jgi:organic hydroperoxide reductase
MKIFYKTSATATAIGGRDGHTQVDDGSIGFDLVWFHFKMTAPELMKNTNAPSMASTAAPTKNGRMGWVKNLFMVWLNSA